MNEISPTYHRLIRFCHRRSQWLLHQANEKTPELVNPRKSALLYSWLEARLRALVPSGPSIPFPSTFSVDESLELLIAEFFELHNTNTKGHQIAEIPADEFNDFVQALGVFRTFVTNELPEEESEWIRNNPDFGGQYVHQCALMRIDADQIAKNDDLASLNALYDLVDLIENSPSDPDKHLSKTHAPNEILEVIQKRKPGLIDLLRDAAIIESKQYLIKSFSKTKVKQNEFSRFYDIATSLLTQYEIQEPVDMDKLALHLTVAMAVSVNMLESKDKFEKNVASKGVKDSYLGYLTSAVRSAIKRGQKNS